MIICTPYMWDAKKRLFVLIKDEAYLKKFKILSYIMYGNMLISTWNLFQVFKKESQQLLHVTSLGTVAITFFATVNRWMHQNGAVGIVQLLNCMVAFQAYNTERGNQFDILFTKAIRTLCNIDITEHN
jgi:hypothetical protein